MCQDTGTAIVMGKRGQNVLTEGGDEEALSRGIYDAYTKLNLRYSQMAPLTMWEEKNTGSNLPAQIELYATDGGAYKFLFMAKGGGSRQQVLPLPGDQGRPQRGLHDEVPGGEDPLAGHGRLPAVPPGDRRRRHVSAEYALKTAKYASAHYLDELPAEGSAARATASATRSWRRRSSS